MDNRETVRVEISMLEMVVNQARRWAALPLLCSLGTLLLRPRPTLEALTWGALGSALFVVPLTVAATALYIQWIIANIRTNSGRFIAEIMPVSTWWGSRCQQAMEWVFIPVFVFVLGSLIVLDSVSPAWPEAVTMADGLFVLGLSVSAAFITLAATWHRRGWREIARATGFAPADVMASYGYQWHWLWGWQFRLSG